MKDHLYITAKGSGFALLIGIIILLLLVGFTAGRALAEEPKQKYQLDFTLRYNAVDADTMAKILTYLELLKKQAGSVRLEPCEWDVNIKKAEEGLTWVIDGSSTIVLPDTYVRFD